MKKRNIMLVVSTIFLVILFTHQPPVNGNAQSPELTKKDTVLIEPVILKVDTTLIDTLKSYKVISDSLKVKCQNQLNFIKQQQKILLEQMEAVEYLTTKN